VEGLWELSNALSNGTVPDPLRPPLPQDWGSQPQPKTAIAIISGTGSYGLQIWPIHSQGPSEQKPIKNFGQFYPRTAQFFEYPHIISGMGKATNFKFCTHIHRIDRNKSPLKISAKVAVGVLRDSRKFSGHQYIGRIARSSLPIKNFGEFYPRTAQFFEYPHIISGMGKATNFKFCTHIHRIDRNKSPLKISAKVAVGVLRDSRKFSGHQYIGRIARSSLR